MKLLFLIATYERPQMLKSLLLQIHTLCPFETEICVVDDNSEADYNDVRLLLEERGYSYYKLQEHRGKKRYWEVVDILFSHAHGCEFDYVYKLDDDVELHPQIFQQSIPLLEKVAGHHNKAMLNLWVDHRANQRVWTGVTPKKTSVGSTTLRKVGWVDGGNWASNRECLEALDWHCPEPPDQWWDGAGDSSGVGKYLSVQLNRRACRIYMPMESLVYHGSHPSQMHPDKTDRPIEMKNKPWE